jgi:hypothetical protein
LWRTIETNGCLSTKPLKKLVIFMVVPIWDSRTVPFHYGVVEMMKEMEIMTLSFMIASLTTVPWYLYLGKIIKNIDFNGQLVNKINDDGTGGRFFF